MPGTTRYSATFDRPYEEDDRADPAPPANARRSRSLSWQAHSGLDGGRPYTPLGSWQPAPRSSSTDNGPSKAAEHIPTRTVGKTTVKTHNNPFQFVKVGTCPLYKKAEEQLKKTKEVKKQDVLKEEEEEWQSNLDSWKSRRRKMSEDVFRRQEEIRQFELEEEQNNQAAAQKKTKTFSEMVNSRATRGRALSLCLLSSPLDFQDWEFENKSLKNGSCSTFTDESEGNSTVNSEDEGVSMRGRLLHLDNQNNHSNGNGHIEQDSLKLETHNGNYSKLDLTTNNGQMKTKEGSYIDSGLESISSSHRAGDTPDSGSDFSQDSNSSIDCDSPRTGVNILEEFSSKSLQISPGQELNVSIILTDKAQEFGFSFQVDKGTSRVLISSVLAGSKAEISGVHLEDQITAIDGIHISSKNHAEITSMVNKAKEKGKITLLLWRHNKTANGLDSTEKHADNSLKENEAESDDAKYQQYEKSIESENEMYVDDFEELQRQSDLLKLNKAENTSTKSQAQSNGNISATTNSSNKNSIKTSAPVLKDTIQNGAVDEKNKNKTDSNVNTESPKKNIIKVKRVRKKGVYSLDVSGPPNQIPQATSVNCLYPLSPVTELPSPADETKTMSSSLSSNPSTPQSNSEKENMLKKTFKEADVQLNSSVMEKNKTAAASKSDVPKTSVPCDKPKFSPLNKVENKTECNNVPSSPTATTAKDAKLSLENSQQEKAQVPSSPKKLKIKVKKANVSTEQKSPELFPTAKEVLPNSSGNKIVDSPIDKKVATGTKFNKIISSDSNSKDNQENMIKSEKLESSHKKENIISTKTTVSAEDAKETSVCNDTASPDKIKKLSLTINAPKEPSDISASPTVEKTKSPKTPKDEKSKPSFAHKKDQMKLKNINSQNVIAPAKQNEDNLNSNIESLNIVFQSEPKNILAKNQSKNFVSIENKSDPKIESDLVPDILPVEKVAEEMEKLILEQLEEEERAKELATEVKCSVGTSEHLLTAPPKLAEPPKEKPPPPPTASEGNQKETSLKRVNSTKRIKKEIHKRRSNFLGIDSADESLISGESSVPPPPALEEILKAEMELDRQSRLKIKNAATERLTLEEKEIMEKEREIIETLESEERMKNLINGTEMYNDASPNSPNDMTYEEDCIFSVKNERKGIEAEHLLSEEQQLNLIEENQLREREEFIRKQEEAIRKERERLRQEQEALQREREEHRRKLILEQEELKKQQKSHAPEASVSRLGPAPSFIPPNYPSQLTTTTNATPNARESASFPSRSHHGDTNGVVTGSINSAELIGASVVRQTKIPAPRKAVQNEAWGQQKMPSVRKQNQDSLTESRYNQNHWLIQEAEMRRIAELKERQQRVPQLSCSQTHLAEDDVCSNPPRVPVITPPHNPHVNYAAVQDKMWNYGQSNLPSKKYPPAVSKDLLHTVYPQETVSQRAPTKPSRVVPLERQEQMLSVSGRKRCSHCNEELGRGAAMIIESLQLYYHIHCFQCCVCQAQLGNGSCGTDVRVRNNKLHCHNCYSNDEAGLKFSQV